MFGLILTLFSAVRSNKYLMYGVAAVVFVGALALFVSKRDNRIRKSGAMAAAVASATAIVKSQERYNEIHQEVKRLPYSDRAARLRATDGNSS
jgi:hypothetical protein